VKDIKDITVTLQLSVCCAKYYQHKLLIMEIRLFSIFTVVLFLFSSCSKKDDCDDPIDCLPAMTQTGANTAGSLVNGEALIPGGQSLNSGPVLEAIYNYSRDDDSVFVLSFKNLRGEGNKMLKITIRNEKLVEGKTYELSSPESNQTGSYNDLHMGGFVTNQENTGELFISKIDEERQIVSGTFWFDAEETRSGEIVKIRNGRFDVPYYTSQ